MGGWGHASPPLSVSLVKRRTVAVAIAAALAGLYVRVLRKSVLNWGATDTEASARLPGDELLEHADGVSTRAIDIDAPPAAVWPWLAQMGPSPRGGAYTYDWIENLLGLNMHSAGGGRGRGGGGRWARRGGGVGGGPAGGGRGRRRAAPPPGGGARPPVRVGVGHPQVDRVREAPARRRVRRRRHRQRRRDGVQR